MGKQPDLAAMVRSSFTAYVATRPRYTIARHHRLIAHHLADVADGSCDRLMVFAPPRHGKSQLVSGFFPAWFLGHRPNRQVIFATYSDTYAADWGRKVRGYVSESAYAGVFGAHVLPYSKAADRFELSNGSLYVSRGVGGSITGKGADLLIIDDPIKTADQALSPTYRQRTIDWYDSVAATRLMPGGRIVLIMTRWTHDDLAGYLEASEGHRWRIVRLPAECDSEDDPLKRSIGEPLWPDWFDSRSFDTHREKSWWSALYQQRPVPRSGGMLKASWWQYYDEVPSSFDEVVGSWDCAFKGESSSDYVVGQVWGRSGERYYLLDSYRARADFPATVRMILAQRDRHRLDALLVEDKANGSAVIDTLKREVRNISPVEPFGSKESRVAAVSYLIEGGQVFLPRKAVFTADFVSEASAFPRGTHDDQVDACTQALYRLSRRQQGGGIEGLYAGLRITPKPRI